MAQSETENTKCTLDAVEQYLFIIIIKLAIISALKIIKVISKVHSSYKRNLKKKYTAKDIEAPKPTQRTSAHT